MRGDIEEQVRQEGNRSRVRNGMFGIGAIMIVMGALLMLGTILVELISRPSFLTGLLFSVGGAVGVAGLGLAGWALWQILTPQPDSP